MTKWITSKYRKSQRTTYISENKEAVSIYMKSKLIHYKIHVPNDWYVSSTASIVVNASHTNWGSLLKSQNY